MMPVRLCYFTENSRPAQCRAGSRQHDLLARVLNRARAYIGEELRGLLEYACRLDDDGNPDRATCDELMAPHVEETERLLEEIDAALRGSVPE